ncbi:MAG: prolyl oligopeptidase family serine peptidase [Rhizobacter sp.]|nr:prolyl oligopeptidase family serine peptidase [Ferruginibacter sp.]
MPRLLFLCLLFAANVCSAQNALGRLSVEKIMRDPKWIGTSPSGVAWSADGKQLFFNWNPIAAPADSMYYISKENKVPAKASSSFVRETVWASAIIYNSKRTAYAYIKNTDIYYTDIKSGKTKRIVNTSDFEYSPQFSFSDTKLVYIRSQNLYAWDINTGETEQLTRIQTGPGNRSGPRDRTENDNEQEKWLRKDQLTNFEVLKQRRAKKDATEAYNKATKEKEVRSIGIEDKNMQSLAISPDGRFVSYRLFKSAPGNKGTIVPDYVTESGFTTDLPARTKVGETQGTFEMFIYDRTNDTLYNIKADTLPGIKDLPDYVKDYPKQLEERIKKNAVRAVNYFAVGWSPKGDRLLLDIRSQDNKDRWLAVWDTASSKLVSADRERNEAWYGGPGSFNRGWINDHVIWFQSEATGYSHLYTLDIKNGIKKQLTSGNYEVLDVNLSIDKKLFYLTTNEIHPGERHFYRLPVSGGKAEKLTTLTGSNTAILSPDEKNIAIVYSYSNKPAELFWQENLPAGRQQKKHATMIAVTDKAQTAAFKSYAWRVPEVITIKARDGTNIYARVYKPARPHSSKPAVIFVHGAGYLQNAHKWWSSYFREYMFHNMLADEGYTVLDIDYRGSAGYGREWRTGIYRFMGGKDLTDHVDAAEWLVKTQGISKDRIGVYGGSYGGFITLMAMFTTPGVFAAGAALRPVTDWAQYNHSYTSNILNEPATDSIAYRRSSPFYFADGLQGNLLMCHGMVDVNVHYQDAVKLSQRLIELGKDNWELASYPMEDHGFVEPSSWTDEYKRIFKLFESVLKK